MASKYEDKLRFNWHDIASYTQTLCDKMTKDEFEPRTIVAVAKGGVIPAGIIHQCFPNATLRVIQASSYKEGHQAGELSIDWQGFPNELDWEDTLVVDDIFDSGATMKMILQHLPRVKYAVVIAKFANLDVLSGLSYYGTILPSKRWVVFPWETK